jgi:23S rRNA (uridine2552-2'-O)-methyltransferase
MSEAKESGEARKTKKIKKTKSSKIWLQEHFSDNYVKRAKRDGYRSRAAYKLLEIQEKYHIIHKGMTVVDLGAAPGSWSEVIAKIIGKTGKIIALDILPMEPIPNVKFICGDFTNDQVVANLLECLNNMDNNQVDLVISDMAPNISGVKCADQARSMYLAELALAFVKKTLKNRGAFLIKVFQGEGFDQFKQSLAQCFVAVKIYKPDASRSRSTEVYLLALGHRLEV